MISQVYGGGGSDAGMPTYSRDYIEIFNRGPSPMDVSTWSVQYASAGGTTWLRTDLSGAIVPGQYILIGGLTGSAGAALPVAVDVGGTIDMSAIAGKVALVSNQTTLPAQACVEGGFNGIVDVVGYGQGTDGVNCSEGVPAPTLTDALADYRALGGCQDIDNNSADFAALPPRPGLGAGTIRLVYTDAAISGDVPASGSSYSLSLLEPVGKLPPKVFRQGFWGMLCAENQGF